MFEHLNKVLFKPTLKVLDEARSKGNARQARDLEQGCLNVGKNYLLLMYENKTLFFNPRPSWMPGQGPIRPRETPIWPRCGQLGGQHAHVARRGGGADW